MPHDTTLITTIVAALVLAFIFGTIANRLKMPPIVGYLIAGVCVGPHSPGFIADQTLAPQLAEIGVILLMFGVGLNFSMKDLLSVKAVAIPGALIRLAFATAMGFGLGTLLGWPALGSLVFGLALGVSSTVVTLKVLQDRHLVDSDRGQVTIGWLVVEDLAMVLALVLIPAFAGSALFAGADGSPTGPDAFVSLAEQLLQTRLELWQVLGLTLIKLLAFVGFMVIVGRRLIPYLLHATAHTGSRELFRLAVLAVALGVAAGSAYLFGVSLALGAFFAGMILSESELSQRAAQETLPLRDAFGVLFFVSVGMLFDPSIIVRDPLPVLATLVIIIFGKSVVGFLLMILFRRPVGAALQISASLAQIGEFSFILAALGVSLGVLPEEGRGLILAGAIISIVLNPAAFWFSERLRPRLEARPSNRRTEPELGPVVPDSDDEGVPLPGGEAGEAFEEVAQPTALANHLVLIGYGRVGMVVAGEMLEEGAPFVLVEDAEGRVQAARDAGIEVIVGNAAAGDTLRLANIMGARCVVIAIPNAFEAGQATEQCRKLNAGVKIIARAHSDEEVDYLTRLGADKVVMGEREIGLGMIDWLKGEERNAVRREDGRVEPRLSGGDNVLRQARQAQPSAATSVAPVAPLAAAAVAAAVVQEEPPMLSESTARVDSSMPPMPTSDDPWVATPSLEESPAQQFAAPPAAVIELPPPAPLAGATSAEADAPAETVIELPPPAAPEALPKVAAAPLADEAPAEDEPFIAVPELVGAAAMLEPDGPVYGPVSRIDPIAPTTAPAPVEVKAPFETVLVPTPDAPNAPAPAAREETPEFQPEPGTPARITALPDEASVETQAVPVGVEPVAARAGFRVVPAADIFILPPELPGVADGEGPVEEPATPFRSEFWQEEEPRPADSGEPQLFESGPIPPGLRNVHEVDAERPPVDDASWLAALERDLFGGETVAAPGAPTSPPEVPQPVPQPIETPQPQEDPPPAPQPAETPQPIEDPRPAPQPIEQPTPQEIPIEAPPSTPAPGAPPTRADDDDDVADGPR